MEKDDKKLLKDLGKRIKKRRRELDWTQVQLSKKLNLSASFLSHVEAGSRNLSLEDLVNTANVLDLSLDYLLNGGNAVNEQSRLVLGDELLNKLQKIFNEI